LPNRHSATPTFGSTHHSVMTTSHLHTTYTHPKDCADRKDAALDRKQHEALRAVRETRQRVLAQNAWLDWYATRPRTLPKPTERTRPS